MHSTGKSRSWILIDNRASFVVARSRGAALFGRDAPYQMLQLLVGLAGSMDGTLGFRDLVARAIARSSLARLNRNPYASITSSLPRMMASNLSTNSGASACNSCRKLEALLPGDSSSVECALGVLC